MTVFAQNNDIGFDDVSRGRVLLYSVEGLRQARVCNIPIPRAAREKVCDEQTKCSRGEERWTIVWKAFELATDFAWVAEHYTVFSMPNCKIACITFLNSLRTFPPCLLMGPFPSNASILVSLKSSEFKMHLKPRPVLRSKDGDAFVDPDSTLFLLFLLLSYLPDEIWWQIIELLLTEEVQRLYSVNRPFLEAAFQQRYRFVDMNKPLDKRRFRDLERHLKDERLAKYIRVIHLCPTIVGDFLNLDIHGRSKWKRVFFDVLQKVNPMQPKQMNLRRQGPSFTGIRVQPGAQTQFDRKILSNLVSLTQLEVECNHFEFSGSAGYVPLVGFLSAGWGSFGQNLQVLKLKMPLLVIHDIVSGYHTTLKLRALQKLSLEVCLPRPPLANDLPEGDVTGLTTLINNHSNTLQALTLRSLYSEHSLDLSLRYLSHLPSLDSFSISIDKTTDCSALHDFLSSHSRQLKNLEIWLEQGSPYLKIPAGYWYQFPCFHVELPGLRSLSLDASCSVHYFETAAAVDYVLRNAELATLRFTARCRSFADNDLFNGKFAVGSNLRKLHIFTNYLNPDLLRFLSTTLPDLQDLTVKYHYLLPQGMSEIYLRGELVAEEDSPGDGVPQHPDI
ncbi:uncharacterized protein LACBIDRAFT_332658 [Laccaria bicolor S238N-H82]|uniref:Predicted protein n=1 Tax=Laccaria bicolor (strain S238N-H82 / ATCC MYA-4686) TaxID=486041 RepID=B0DTG6_LACBS|nr:uncharacterized protein LACBIDRAFT_332658 [Laccaria bicolor S238N-H82]EDR02108.1 predicted protein [Laccaria bicolor S238N-H82]|eukprot:XP_001887265.1 predicted protein [Laccaria bicolor S238N-H82]